MPMGPRWLNSGQVHPANTASSRTAIQVEAEMQALWIDTVLDEGEPTADAVEAVRPDHQAALSEEK